MSTSISCPKLLKVDGPRWRQRTGQNQHPTVFPIKRRLAKQRIPNSEQQTTNNMWRAATFGLFLRLARTLATALNLNLYVADRSVPKAPNAPQDPDQRAVWFGQSVIRTDRLTNWWPADWLNDGLLIDLWPNVGCLNWIMESMDWSELDVDRVFIHDSAYNVVNNIFRLIWFAKIAH